MHECALARAGPPGHGGGRVWSNWSGGLRFTPARIVAPHDKEELGQVVLEAGRRGTSVRPVGAGHSSSPLVQGDVLVSLERFGSLVDHDASRCEATVGAGMTLRDAGRALLSVGLAFENLGDIDEQTVAGAFATGTHGSGRHLRILADHLVGVRFVDAAGEVVEWHEEREPELLRAARVSLGALGIATHLRLRLLPRYRLHRREWRTRLDDCLTHLDEWLARHRNLDFYWYPRRDDVKVRSHDEIDDEVVEPSGLLRPERGVEQRVGWSSEVIAKVRTLRFHEMEYAVPVEAGPACFQAVRQRILERHRRDVAWRVLYRVVDGDDAFLSPAHGGRVATISIHQNATLPYREFFADIEPIFLDHQGRPHWAKVHNQYGPELLARHPAAGDFLAVRERVDPEQRFTNAYLRRLLALPAPSRA